MMAFLLASAGTARTSLALPPNAPPGLRHGANHHTGDDGFVAHLGREPGPGDEKLRMHEHFVAVRARLAARKATRPELEAMRQKILAHLDAYIAKGTTPDNAHLPWRTPVFIDDDHTICAVGYLIEQTAGRALADKIAQDHRYDFIEDIARAMPEVRAWVEASGFTLDELGQIQPGYRGPEVLLWQVWHETEDTKIEDGAYEHATLVGAFRHHRMEGTWTRKTEDGVVLGLGQLHHGNGAWTSYFASGAKLAEGRYVHNKPDGAWRFYHESGNLAAEGNFLEGQRTGAWQFYYDAKEPTPIATGRFRNNGTIAGTWSHYDARGRLLATSVVNTPEQFHKDHQLFWSIGYLVNIVPTADHIEHQIHQGSIDGDPIRLDMLATADGRDRIYVRDRGGEVFDVHGNKLVAVDGGWRADDCHWNKARKHAAQAGDVAALHGLIFAASDGTDGTGDGCTTGGLVPEARAERIATLVGAMKEVRAASPQFLQKLALDGEAPEDLTNVIASNMSLDIEWPHVDGRFIQVYKTLPGYANGY
jgi:MORN repeat protein